MGEQERRRDEKRREEKRERGEEKRGEETTREEKRWLVLCELSFKSHYQH